MDNNLEKIEHLLGLFDQRDKLWQSSTRKIARSVNDTLLVALKDLLGVADDALVWNDFAVADVVVVLKFSITYNPTEPMTPFLAMVSTSNPETALLEIQRTMQIGVPLATAFLPPEEIKMWLMKMAEDTFGVLPGASPTVVPTEAPTKPDVESVPPPTGFDPSKLTSDQVKQLLYFQQLTKGVKQ